MTRIKELLIRISLWNTLPKVYSFWKKIDILFNSGILCKCKKCHKYFIREKETTNLKYCNVCWILNIKLRRFKRGNRDE